MKVLSDEYDEAHSSKWMIMGEYDSERDETLRPRKRKHATRKDRSKAFAQAVKAQELLS